MIICFDLRALQIGHENRGIGMYIKSVLEHVPGSDNQYIIYAFDKGDPIKDLNIRVNFNYELVQTPTIKTALNSPRDIVGLIKLVNHRFYGLKKHRPDVFVQFDFTLGIPRWSGVKTVVIGYDLIPLIKKNEYLPGPIYAWHHTLGKKAKPRAVVRSVYYRLKYHLHYQVYKRAAQIIGISKATSQSFDQVLHIEPKKIHTIPLAPAFSTNEHDESILESVKKPYILYIGGSDSRKRIQDIVYAFQIARSQGAELRLVLAGNEFKELKQLPNVEARNVMLDSPYQDDICFLGFVTDAQKMALYQNAHAFIFCTTYEGFGLPIVEAMEANCPVISYNNSSIPEAAGDAALLVKTGDYVAASKQILALYDQGLRKELVAKGLKQAKKFNWPDYINNFIKTVEQM